MKPMVLLLLLLLDLTFSVNIPSSPHQPQCTFCALDLETLLQESERRDRERRINGKKKEKAGVCM
jgi:hypothetical protein